MIRQTILYGPIEIPDTKEEVAAKLIMCRKRFLYRPSGYLQAKIDELEYVLDDFRRMEAYV